MTAARDGKGSDALSNAVISRPTSKAELAAYIDQTHLGLGTSEQEVAAFIREAVELGFYAVCVLPNMVPLARRLTHGADTKVAAVVSFPLGADVAVVKAAEARALIDLGADEIDMVVNVSAARDRDRDSIIREVAAVREVMRGGQLLKTIIEVPLLTEEQAVAAALAAELGGAHIVKTSTGFKGLKLRSTTPADVRLLRNALKSATGIKASGGVRTTEDALAMIDAGATRLGTSSGVAILAGFGHD